MQGNSAMDNAAAVAGGITAKDSQWFGHPRGVSTLFFTEMWERFSYYGMRAFLILYMVAPVEKGGLGFDVKHSADIYGYYTGSVWALSIGGGLVADWLLGQYRSVLLGGILITLGHFTLAFRELTFFYLGLILIVLGTGLLKPNISTMVGSLYAPGDTRRDAGFSIFYMGINLGAAIGPLIAGTLAQNVNWHLGFACAGIGMAAGLVQYVVGRKYLVNAIDRLDKKPQADPVTGAPAPKAAFTAVEWKRLAAIVALFVFATIFWACYEQAGSTLNLFADRYTRLSVFGWSFPSSWFQSVPAIYVIAFAPVAAWLWVRLGSKEPSSPMKFFIALLLVGLSFLLLVPASRIAQSALGIKVSPMWLVGVYFLSVAGELCLSPVGLSLVTKLAPVRIVGLMMGVWLLSIAFGNIIGSKIAGLFQAYPLTQIFTTVGVATIVAAFILLVLIKPLKKLMGGVH
jgi:proton-dependent oligopeptide transporter, POT family